MDVISISDSNSDGAGPIGDDAKATPPRNNEVEITTISSLKSSEVCTSKKSNLSLLNSKPFCSPSPKSKVTCWLSKNSMEDFSTPLEEAPLIIETDLYFEGFKDRTPTKNPIMVRQDYNKSLNETDTKLSHTSSDVISIHSRNSSAVRCLDGNETPPPVRIMQDLVNSITSLCEQVPKNGDDLKPKKLLRTPTSVPMSPESRNKNELCEYLKLMNMNTSDQKVINLSQNRRSTRVKHLAIMTEKRELDKRLHKEIEDMEKNKKAERRSSIGSKTSARRRNGSVESLIDSSETSKKARSILCDDESKSVKSNTRNGRKLKLKTQNVPSLNKETSDAIKNAINGRSSVEFNRKEKLPTNLESNPLKFVIPLARISATPIDFEESIKDVLMEENILGKPPPQIPKKLKEKQPRKSKYKKNLKALLVKWNTNSTKPTKLKRKDSKINRILKRIVKGKPKNPSASFTKSSKINKKNSKLKNFVVNSKHVNKLRSRGRLKRVEFTTLLRKGEKIEKTKKAKRTKKKIPTLVEEPPIDEDKQVENSSCSNKDTSFSHKSIDLIFFEQKIHQINTELNYLNNLTPEHRKALFESKKFLDEAAAQGGKKEKEAIADFVPFRGFCNEVVTPKVSQEEETSFENDPISCEDLEVDRLMSGRELTGSSDELQTFSSTSCDSSSMQTVEEIASPVPCTSKNQTEVAEKETTAKTPDAETESEKSDDDSQCTPLEPEVVNIAKIKPSKCKFVNMPVEVEVKSLHHYLTQPLKKFKEKYRNNSPSSQKNFGDHFSAEKRSTQSHTIFLSNTNGCVMGAYYLDYNLIVVQELLVSFWNQTPLGSVLGAQDMWIPKGNTSRIVLSNGCIPIESSEMVISADTLVAYFELWVKEHKSDKRERPVADIFVTIYFRNRSGPDKKVLQLENIHSSPNDVQYVVLRNTPNIVVTWNVIDNDVSTTVLHCYQLSPDYQTVISIKKMQTISHYVSSLHNIQDCDTLIMGCGNGKVTLCNIEFGYVVATIDLVQIIPQPRILWARCDRGFLFTLHQFEDGSLHLIAINSFDSTWKKLQTYKPGTEFENLSGVCMENGILVAFYENGILCWSARSGDLLLEDGVDDNIFFPFGKYVIVVINNQVHVRHALGYLMCED